MTNVLQELQTSTMNENTLQFVIKLFAIAVFVVTIVVTSTLGIIVIRDGNDPLINTAFNDLVTFGENGFYVLGLVIVGKPIATGLMNKLSNGNTPQIQSSQTTATPATPAT